ncbi:GAF domain-containing sensor histidine kinase [Halovivax cerinus]|uniref:histidine kinase n=1 Tax=Halovivax cerinus TaxID=1487865 RepID=A0ABD5NIU3_9EURY|nr:ATP-binding protein [Halovivax cerinus]
MVPSPEAVRERFSDTDVDVVITGPSTSVSAIDSIRRADPSVPVVAVLDGDTRPDEVLDAGATDCLPLTDDPATTATLLDRRIDALPDRVGDGDRDDGSAVLQAHVGALTALLDEEDTLLGVFDAEYRHVTVVGTAVTDDLAPETLEGRTLVGAWVDPSVEPYLRAAYDDALAGEEGTSEFVIDGRPVRVQTRPVPGTSYGLVRFDPIVGVDVRPDERPGNRERIERLRSISRELDAQEDVAHISEFVVERVSELLDFDACVIADAGDETFDVLAATGAEPYTDTGPLTVDDGIAGRTVAEDRTFVIDDIREETAAEPTSPTYRSAISIPMGETGVFQALAAEPGAYTEMDRKLAELLVVHAAHAMARVRFEEALTLERDRFAALFQNIPDAAVTYVIAAGEPQIESVNSAFVRLFGFDPEDAAGESVRDLLVPPEADEDAASLYEAVEDGERVDAEVTRRTVDGTAPFLLRSVPVQSDDDRQRGYFIYTDISTLVERERELERQNERLDTFASIVSHDLRNPLSVAEGYLETAVDTGEVEYLDVVGEELDRMRRMIEDLLTLAREGEAIGDREPVALEAVAQRAWDGIDTADGTLSIGSLPTVRADPARVRQLFENLFRNAVLHGGDTVSVDVGPFDGGVYVDDDGPGVPDELKEEILEMGVSTAKDEGGTGFGLSIVAQVAAGHGWDVVVADSDRGGARFEIHFDSDPNGSTRPDTPGPNDDEKSASNSDAETTGSHLDDESSGSPSNESTALPTDDVSGSDEGASPPTEEHRDETDGGESIP